ESQHDRSKQKAGKNTGQGLHNRLLFKLPVRFKTPPFKFTDFFGHLPGLNLRCSISDYLITLSARANTFGIIVTPICWAVFRLITSSNLDAFSTGKSAGLAPFRILSKYTTACRELSASLAA